MKTIEWDATDNTPREGVTGDIHDIQKEFIREFGEAYLRFGLPKLMGNIVGLLLIEEGPLSLSDITSTLGVSKGPVSQVMTRLRDHGLVIRETIPGNRSDFYRSAGNIFGQAFSNHLQLFEQNLAIANRFNSLLKQQNQEGYFADRVEEMSRFYQLMLKHLDNFMQEWSTIHKSINSSEDQ